MAELMHPDIPGAYQRGMATGWQNKLLTQQEQRTNRLADLASQAYGAPPEQRSPLVRLAIQNDPESGMKLGQYLQDDETQKLKKVVGMARYFVSVPEEQRAAAYRGMLPSFTELGMSGFPTDYTPESSGLILDTANALVRAYGGAGQEQGYTLGPGSRRYDANNNIVAEVPFAPVSAQYVDVPDGRGGSYKMLLDPRAKQFIAPNYGGQASTAPPLSPTGERRDAFDQFIAPILADAEAQGKPLSGPEFMELYRQYQAGGAGNIAMRDGQRIPASELETTAPPQAAPSGGFGYTPPKEREAPSGFRFMADGQTLEPIPGGPNDPSTAGIANKDEQALRKEVSDLVKQDRTIIGMYGNVKNASDNPSAAGDLAMIFAFMKMLDPGSVVREQEFANAQNAAGVPDRIRAAYNRALEGQRLSKGQREDFLSQAQSLADQAQKRITSTARNYQGIADQYGFDPSRATGMPDFRGVNVGQPAPGMYAPAPSDGPRPGDVQDGFRFRGGNPADPNAWERL